MAELICKTVFPIKLNIVVADCEDITQEILEEYCDSICIYPSYSADKNISREYSYETMIRNSDCVIFYADSPFNNEIGAYYRFATTSGKAVINMFFTVEKSTDFD